MASTATRWDLAIVGASFAGLACAKAAACRGVRTIVIDRKPEPGAHVRTTGILVKELADEWDVPRRLTRKIFGVRLYAPSLRFVDLESPGYYFLATNTAALLRWYSTQALMAGATLCNAMSFRDVSRDGEHLVLDPSSIRCRYLVGADGPKSTVARRLGLGVNRRVLVGHEYEMEGVRGVDEDRLHVFLDSRLARGYIAWIVPGVGVTQVGLACSSSAKPDVDAFIARVSSMFDFSSAKVVERRGGPIPIGGPVRRMAAERVMLIGDAAGLVSPLTAGGIHTAVHYGRSAGVVVADHLQDGGVDPARAMRAILPRFLFKRALRSCWSLHPPNAMIDLALSVPVVRRLAQTVFYHHRGLMTWPAWRDVMLAWR